MARAAHLPVLPHFMPDIASFGILVNYNAVTGGFAATGTALAIDFNDVAPPDYTITGGIFSINMTVDQATGGLIDGSLSITGTIVPLGLSGTLLTGSLLDFGFGATGDQIFEFAFDAIGGALEPYYSSNGMVVLNAKNANFTGVFTSSFTNAKYYKGKPYGVGTADTYLSPEPSSLMALSFLGPAGVFSGIRAWRRRRKPAA
jgi:hypothetical protein